MRKSRALLFFGVLAGGALSMQTAAFAACSSTGQVEAVHLQLSMKLSQVETSINGQIQTTEYNIVEALRKATGQLSSNIKEHTTAMARIADAQDDQIVKRRLEDERLDSLKGALPSRSRCVTTSSSILGSTLAQNATFTRQGTGQAMTNWQLGLTEVAKEGSQSVQESLLSAHCEFAGPADVEAGLCPSVEKPDEWQYAHVDAGRSLFGAQTYDDDGEKATATLVTNIMAMEPFEPLSAQEAQTAEGRKKIVTRNHLLSSNSVAVDAMNAIVASRQGVEDSNLAAWAKARADITGRSGSSLQIEFPDNVSVNDHLELQSRAWFFDEEFLKGVQAQNMDAKVATLVDMLSFQVYQNWKQYEMLERMTSILATQLSIQVNAERASAE